MHEINIDASERNICHDSDEKFWMEGKPEKLRKAGHRIFTGNTNQRRKKNK